MKKGAIFDMDGLLTDTERFYSVSWRDTARSFGQPWVEGFDRFVAGTNGEKMLEIIHTHFPAVDAQAFMDACVEREHNLVRTQLREMPGAAEIVRFFHERGVKLAVASSSSLSDIRDNLGRLGMLDFFACERAGGNARTRKARAGYFPAGGGADRLCAGRVLCL